MRQLLPLHLVGVLAWIGLLAVARARADRPLVVEGHGFVIRPFAENAVAYGNRRYVWKSVPDRFKGWQFTQTRGGVRSHFAVTPPADGVIHVATAAGGKGVDLAGWQKVEGVTFHYTDKGKTTMTIFQRNARSGERVLIPQGNWSGTIVLAASLTGTAKAPALDHSAVPGVVIDHSPAASRRYIGSPALAVLPGGSYVASHDFFGPGSKRNRTSVHASGDRGKTWAKLGEIEGQWWSSLFVQGKALYLIGAGREYGHTVIRRSEDGGKTWTTPADAKTGLLLADARYHCAPVPVVVHRGRVWRAMEDASGPGGWGKHFRSFMMSAPADANLLRRESWMFTNRLAREGSWLGGAFGGWLEGNAVVAPDGRIVNILRVDCPRGGKAAIVRVSDDGKTQTFDPDEDFIDLPGGSKKFTIRRDPKTKHYWSLVNWIQPKDRQARTKASLIRNTLALATSEDLRNWTIRSIVLHHPDTRNHAFQYVDWLFEGDDLIAVSRTAYDDGLGGAHRQHDANYLTFHRIAGFRTRTMVAPAGNHGAAR